MASPRADASRATRADRPSAASAFVVAAVLTAITSGCGLALSASGGFEPAGAGGGQSSDASATSGSWGTGGAGGTEAISAGTTSGTGGTTNTTPPYANGSYAYLCGGANQDCVPGTEDCTPGGDPGMGNGTGGSMIACLLTAEGTKPVAACATVGDFAAGDPCETAAHCGPGLGCVATPSGGVCRSYCCEAVEDCAADTYCAPLAMAEAPVTIPVCIPVKKCKPLDDTTCDNGQTCTIVRDDGTTSCVDPGASIRGGSCPCAPGFMCSKINNTCLQLCHLGNDADCMGGTCQGGVMGYPDGIGVCVGYP